MKKTILIMMFITLSFVLTGCNSATNNNQAMTNIDQTITKITSTVKKLDAISNDSLLMKDFMNESSLVDNTRTNLYNPYQNSNNGYNGATFTNVSPMTTYIGKLQNLSSVVTLTISSNNELNYLKDCILSRSSYIKTSCNQIKDKNCNVTDGQKNAINDLCNNLVVNLNRINLTKNEIVNEVNSVTTLKNNYTSNIDQLNSKYTRLLNCIETRTLYFKNILTSMNGIDNILNEICCPQNSYANSRYDNETTTNSQVKNNKIIKSNIDTYENANSKKINNNNINNNNVVNHPQQHNPYYYNNFQQLPYRQFYGYNFGYPHSPYSNYNPYMPNIDTFINYNNVDTYKSQEKINKEQQEDDKKTNDTTNTQTINNNATKPVTKKYYTVAEEDYLKYKEYVNNKEKATN